ncbi:MAG: hypothetical protein IPH52_28510 [Leptospiraceae bacterium]|nr:hypothetical protein [Leptospiraceae bacterium]
MDVQRFNTNWVLCVVTCFILRNEANQKESMFFRIGSGNFRQDPYYKEPYLLNQPPKRIYHFDQRKFAAIEGSPMIYWWTESFRNWYLGADKVGDVGDVKTGTNSRNNDRFYRVFWELSIKNIFIRLIDEVLVKKYFKFVPLVKGAGTRRWFEPLKDCILINNGINQFIEIQENAWKLGGGGGVQSPDYYFKQGISYSYIGASDLFCRIRKYQSAFDKAASSMFPDNPKKLQVALSTRVVPYVSQSINPTINNQVGDIKNLPIPVVENWQDYIERARVLYDEEFSRDETNVEYLYG